MQFCIPLAFQPTAHWGPLARAAEDAGFAGIILSDHLIYPGELRTPYPYTTDGRPQWEPTTDWPDPLIAVGALSAHTSRIRFITSIYLLALRHPVLAAKAIASADQFANGRLTLGVGAGWMREEFALLDVPFERRGARMVEALAVMRKLFTGDVVEHHGEFYDFAPLQMRPLPRGDVPIWGGGTTDVALRRAATRMQGWVSQILRSADVRALVPRLHAYRADSPLAGEPFEICSAVEDAYTPDRYREMGELGVTHMITVPWMLYGLRGADALDVQKQCDALRRFGDEVIAVQ